MVLPLKDLCGKRRLRLLSTAAAATMRDDSISNDAPQTTRTTPSLTASLGYSPHPLSCLSFTGFVSQRPQDLELHRDDQSTMTMMMQQAGRRHGSLAALALLGLQLTTTLAFVFPSSSLSTPSQGTSLGWSSQVWWEESGSS